MKTTQTISLSLFLVFVASAVRADWPAFRGQGNGVSSERGLPVQWGKEKNVLWQAELPGPGASSPVVWKNHVFITCYSGYGDGTPKSDVKQLVRHLVCLDRQSGKILWQKNIPAKQPECNYEDRLTEHGYASSTPVTDGERVIVFFGRTGVLAFDFAGKPLWDVEVGKGLNFWGSGASPILHGDLVIVNATVEDGVLVALNKTNGKEVWRAKNPVNCWTTPVTVKTPEGKHEVVLHTTGFLRGFDPTNGKKLWECTTTSSGHIGSSPIARNGIVYVMGSGYEGRWIMAVRAGGKGDVTKTHVVWDRRKVGANYTSPVLVGDRLYCASSLLSCLHADTGKIVFEKRLAGLGREYVSPVFADGKLFVCTREGSTHVLTAKDQLDPLARNRIVDEDTFIASPAISQGQMFLRSSKILYCIGTKK